MIKVSIPGAWDFQEKAASHVKVASQGLRGNDLQEFIKRAGHDFANAVKTAELAPGEEPVHFLIVGSTEAYGPNRNGDGFRDDVCAKYAHTFEKFARFYRNHQNKDPKKSYGRIIKAAYHRPMQRIELLVGLNGTKEAAERNDGFVADKEMQKLASGEDIPVSMACVTDPDYPVLTRDRGYVRIADIAVGDFVWTHKGRWRRVQQLNRRPYSGRVYKFRANGQPLELELTADHPMWAKVFAGSRETAAVKAKATRYFKDAAAFDASPAGWQHAAHVGVGDRFFYRPVTTYTGYGRVNDTRLAALLGYYLAEGSLAYNGDRACTVEFSCNMSDSLPRRVPRLLETMYPDVTVDIKPKDNSDSGLAVCVYNTEFAEFMRQYVGRGVQKKSIPPEIFNADEENRVAFLGAWLDGDGWIDKKGGHWSSANPHLVLQGRDLLASLGIPSSIYRIDHAACETSGMPGSGLEYTLNVSHVDLWMLAGGSEKVADYPTITRKRQKPATMRRCPDDTYAYRISQVSYRDVENIVTYNFEVEEDESYSLGGFISHNCRVPFDVCSGCGKRSRTQKEYCTADMCKYGGLKENITKVAADGHILHADNPNPSFFDCSNVWRPADRIAYSMGQMMQKAASAPIAGAALAAQLGISAPCDILIDEDTPAWVADMLKLAYDMADVEDAAAHADPCLGFAKQAQAPAAEFPAIETADQLCQMLTAMAMEKIALPVGEFLAMSLGDRARAEGIEDEVRRQLPGVFGRLVKSGSLETLIATNPYLTGVKLPSAPYRTWALKHAEQFSLRPEHVTRRTQLAALRGVVSHQAPSDAAEIEKQASDNTGVEQLARHYALYKLAFLAHEQKCDQPGFRTTSTFTARQNFVI